MGYGGVISLKQTIQRLLDSSKFTVDSSTREILGFAYKEATSLQQLLGDCDGGDKSRLDRLDGQIRETVHKLEDFLELHQSDLFLDEDNLSIHSERVRQEINWFSERAKKLGEDYGAEGSADEEEDDAAPASSSNSGFCEEMVGFSDDLRSMERYVTSTLRPDDWGIMVIFGAAGTGRSLVAKKVLNDVMSCGELCFDYGVWVSVGPDYERERILQLILSQILKIDNGGVAGSEEQHKRCLWSRLEGRRYMIVLDDVCDTDIFDYLINMFPLQNNGSVVLVTTGAMVVRIHVRPYCVYVMSLYSDNINLVDEFWDVLRNELFRLQPVPPELEEAGRKSFWNCRGLRLCMSKVLLYLWSAERSSEAWNEIAFDQHHPLFQFADEFLEARIQMASSVKYVRVGPNSASIEAARRRVFDFFKTACRSIPAIMEVYNRDDVVTLSQLCSNVTSKIRKNAHVNNPKLVVSMRQLRSSSLFLKAAGLLYLVKPIAKQSGFH